jgi:hypothetical protein
VGGADPSSGRTRTFCETCAPSAPSTSRPEIGLNSRETDLTDEDLDTLAAILAAAYLRYRDSAAAAALPFSELDTHTERSVHGPVNGERRDG